MRGILFDLDGTLVDSERTYAEAMARALDLEHGIAISQYDRDFIIGRSWVAIYDSLRSRYPQLTWSREELVSQTMRARGSLPLSILPGVRAALAWTRAHPRALVTGSSRAEATHVLPQIGPEAAFDVMVTSEDVAQSKPAPDGYRQAMAQLKLPASSCLVVEDSVSGIAAGRAAGCVVLAVRAGNFGGWDQSGAHRVIDTLEAFTPALVEELFAVYGSGDGAVR